MKVFNNSASSRSAVSSKNLFLVLSDSSVFIGLEKIAAVEEVLDDIAWALGLKQVV